MANEIGDGKAVVTPIVEFVLQNSIVVVLSVGIGLLLTAIILDVIEGRDDEEEKYDE